MGPSSYQLQPAFFLHLPAPQLHQVSPAPLHVPTPAESGTGKRHRQTCHCSFTMMWGYSGNYGQNKRDWAKPWERTKSVHTQLPHSSLSDTPPHTHTRHTCPQSMPGWGLWGAARLNDASWHLGSAAIPWLPGSWVKSLGSGDFLEHPLGLFQTWFPRVGFPNRTVLYSKYKRLRKD